MSAPAVLTYTLARIGIFVLVWVPVLLISLIWLDFDRLAVLWTMLIAWVISAFVSYRLLAGQRNRLARETERGVNRVRGRIDESRGKEDSDG